MQADIMPHIGEDHFSFVPLQLYSDLLDSLDQPKNSQDLSKFTVNLSLKQKKYYTQYIQYSCSLTFQQLPCNSTI